MTPKYWSLLGLMLDIIGGALLSVEAIKLENLRKLRGGILKQGRWILPPVITLPNPGIDSGEPSRPAEEADLRGTALSSLSLAIYLGIHYLAGIVVSAVLYFVLRKFGFDLVNFIGQILSSASGMAKAAVFAGIIVAGIFYAVSVLFILGELVHQLASAAWQASLWCLTTVDKSTPSGGVGMIGATLLLLGFIGQFLGTLLAG
ncbi:hypothetical protein AB0B85_11155 [Micromonospora sp. NPDC049044]|uniref:hypothetical protein n=1 Tax=Micromonospora sp. NPDC049044 TaxID=3154827 RepID=UPI0033EE6B81